MSSIDSPSKEHRKLQLHFLDDIERNVTKYKNCVKTQVAFVDSQIYKLERFNDINGKHVADSRLSSIESSKLYRDSINKETQRNEEKLKTFIKQREELSERNQQTSRWSDYMYEMRK